MNKTDKIFHASVGAHNNPPTPFQLIGGAVKSVVKSAGKAVLHTLVDPSIAVAKKKDAKMQEMSVKAKRGDFNSY